MCACCVLSLSAHWDELVLAASSLPLTQLSTCPEHGRVKGARGQDDKARHVCLELHDYTEQGSTGRDCQDTRYCFEVLVLATTEDIIVDIIPLLCRGSSVSYYAERRL